jgi:hypothetical protein
VSPHLRFQVSYPAIIQSAFGLFSCKPLADDSSTFLFAQHLDCDSDEARVARAVAAASLAIWGVGFPLFLGAIIRRFADNPNYSFVIVSYGYKSHLRYWEAWECIKKFLILLIITFLRSFPELAAATLLLFLCAAMIATALAEPFISSLVNKAHLACDFLIFFVLLAGLLSTCAGKARSEEVEQVGTLSIFVVSYAAILFAALGGILWLETGSMFHKGGRRQATWEKFLESGPGAAAKMLTKRLSNFVAKRLSTMTAFSTVAPEAATSCAVHTVVQVSDAAVGTSASRALPDVSALNKMRAHLRALSLASDAMLADVDDGDNLKTQLEKCALKLEPLGNDGLPSNLQGE